MAASKARLNPGGGMRQDKIVRDAMVLAIKQDETKGGAKRKRLHWIIERVMEAALRGESWAINMIFDRIDGKPHQTNTMDKTESMTVIVQWGTEPIEQDGTDLIDVTPDSAE